MRNYGHEAEAAAWERDYDKAMNDVMGLSELVGIRNGELNDLESIISNALGHIDKFPMLESHDSYEDGAAWSFNFYDKKDVENWLLDLRNILYDRLVTIPS